MQFQCTRALSDWRSNPCDIAGRPQVCMTSRMSCDMGSSGGDRHVKSLPRRKRTTTPLLVARIWMLTRARVGDHDCHGCACIFAGREGKLRVWEASCGAIHTLDLQTLATLLGVGQPWRVDGSCEPHSWLWQLLPCRDTDQTLPQAAWPCSGVQRLLFQGRALGRSAGCRRSKKLGCRCLEDMKKEQQSSIGSPT